MREKFFKEMFNLFKELPCIYGFHKWEIKFDTFNDDKIKFEKCIKCGKNRRWLILRNGKYYKHRGSL